MIPFVDERLVDLLQEGQSAMKSPPDVLFWYIVAAGCHANSHPPDGVVVGRQLDEVKDDSVTCLPPRSHVPDVHRR